MRRPHGFESESEVQKFQIDSSQNHKKLQFLPNGANQSTFHVEHHQKYEPEWIIV